MLSQGQYIGNESFNIEYKEFCLKDLESYYTVDQIREFLLNQIRLDDSIFNKMIYFTLNDYIYKYLPKYIGNFSKAGISGEIYFGVNDDGIIEGIPWYGELNIRLIKKIIKNVYKSNRSRGIKIDKLTDKYEYNDDVLDWYYSNLIINIYELNINETMTDKIYDENMKKLDLLIEENNNIKKEWNKYKQLYLDWHTKLIKYSCKLNNYITDDILYNEVIRFIISEIDDKSILNKILDFYKDKTNFDNFLSNDEKNIYSIMDDESNYIIWIIKYKDLTISKLKRIRPVKPRYNQINSLFFIFSNHISNIKAHLLKLSNVKYYLIKITIPNMFNTYLEYRDDISSPWISRQRILINSGPSCY
jgi:hypothetical protein